jgi:hypothetical protein
MLHVRRNTARFIVEVSSLANVHTGEVFRPAILQISAGAAGDDQELGRDQPSTSSNIIVPLGP